MTAAEALAAWLESRPYADGEGIVGWRFEIVEGEGVRMGVRASRLGGPYEGPGSAPRLGGSIDLHWSDGQQSRVGLDRRAILDPAAELAEWRSSAFSEPDGHLPSMAGPAVLPPVETLDPGVARGVSEDPARFLGTLDQLRASTLEAGVQRVDGVLRASQGRRSVGTSHGFWAAWEETTCSIDLWADEIAHAVYSRRAEPTAADLDRLVTDVATLARQLRLQQKLPGGTIGILFTPGVVDEMLGRLILPNLAGRSIRDGRSPFTRADLEAGRQIIRPDLDLIVDTTLPLELATAPCSSDGVPAGRVPLIAGGRLVSPILDLATADDFGRPPTPAPRGRPSAVLASRAPSIELDAALALLGSGVVIRDLPGLHTQQSRRSRYALVTPDAQVVVNGVAGGRCAVRIAGNVLDHLTQPTTRLVRISGELGVGLLVLMGGEVLPA